MQTKYIHQNIYIHTVIIHEIAPLLLIITAIMIIDYQQQYE